MEQTKIHIEISNQIMRIDTTRAVFDLRQIDNRRFMFSAQSGELILGAQYRSHCLHSSHAQEHAQSGAAAAYDSFVRGWIGTSRQYPYGVIHFAPAIDTANEEIYTSAFEALKMFQENGAVGATVVRGFGGIWEQFMRNIYNRNEGM